MATRGTIFWLSLTVTLLAGVFLFVPMFLSVLAGVTRDYFIGWQSGLTTRWIVQVWQGYSSTIWLSLGIAVVCLACTIVVGVPAAYALSTSESRASRLLEELLVLPIAVPGLATALGLIVVYGGVSGLRSSAFLILVGHVLFTLPFMVRSVLAVLNSIDLKTLEEGARSLGASFWQRFFHIVVPNCRTGILAGALMVLTLSMGEFNMTLLLHTPLTRTLPVGLSDAYTQMRLEFGSAYTLIFFILIIPMLLLLQAFTAWADAKSKRPAK
jgi:putative spermidine/putrescine transport system permease protein